MSSKDIPLEEREFLCYWGNSQYDLDPNERHIGRLKFDFFSEDTGWDEPERKMIANLELDDYMDALGSLYDILVLRTK